MASIYRPKGSSYWWISYYINRQLTRYSLKTRDEKIARRIKEEKEELLVRMYGKGSFDGYTKITTESY